MSSSTEGEANKPDRWKGAGRAAFDAPTQSTASGNKKGRLVAVLPYQPR